MNSIALLAQEAVFKEIRSEGFGDWLVYLLVFFMIGERIMAWVRPRQTEVRGSLETRQEKSYAEASEVAELKQDVQAMREENASQHQAAAVAGQHRVQDLSRVFSEETKDLEQRIQTFQEKLSERLDEGFASLHEKLNLTALQVAGHHAQLPGFEKRLEELTARYNKAIPDLHKRIDDAMARKRS